MLPFALSSPSERTILDLGFSATRTRGTYARPGTPFTLEFIDGPLAVGDTVIRAWATHRREDRLLHVLSPTDSVRDRLAGAIYWNDFAAIRQALAIIRLHPVDMEAIRVWCEEEGGVRIFETLRLLLERPTEGH